MLPSGKAFVVPSFSSFSVRGSTQGLVHGSKVLLSLSHSRVQTVCTAVLSVSGELCAQVLASRQASCSAQDSFRKHYLDTDVNWVGFEESISTFRGPNWRSKNISFLSSSSSSPTADGNLLFVAVLDFPLNLFSIPFSFLTCRRIYLCTSKLDFEPFDCFLSFLMYTHIRARFLDFFFFLFLNQCTL